MTEKNRLRASLTLDLSSAAFNAVAAFFVSSRLSILLATFAVGCVLTAVANVVLFRKRHITKYYVLFFDNGDAEVSVPDGEGAYNCIVKAHPGRCVKDFWPIRTEYVHIELTGRTTRSKITWRDGKGLK